MEIKQNALIPGSSDPEFILAPHLEGREDCTDFGKVGAVNRQHSSRLPKVARSTGEANPPLNPHRPPQRKKKTVRLRELQTLVQFPASTLRPMTRDGIFVKAAPGAAPARKWNRGAVEQWIAGQQLEVSWPANDAYGTAYDPAPEIRRHMRAILNGSAEPMGRARV